MPRARLAAFWWPFWESLWIHVGREKYHEEEHPGTVGSCDKCWEEYSSQFFSNFPSCRGFVFWIMILVVGMLAFIAFSDFFWGVHEQTREQFQFPADSTFR